MKKNLFLSLFLLSVIAISNATLWAQAPAKPANKGPKLCVAQPANSSNLPVFADDLKTSLYEAMLKAGLNADDTPSATMLATKLDMSYKNELVAKRLHCDFMLLSEIAAGPGGANELRLDFAVFRKEAGDQPSILTMNGSEAVQKKEKLTDGYLAVTPKVATRVYAAVYPKKAAPKN